VIFLAPFIAMMAAQILTGAFAPYDHALYPLKVLAIAAAIYVYRIAYARLAEAPSALSLWMGAAAGILWIATDPGAGNNPPLAGWLAQLTPLAFVAWLVFRGIGTIVMVPIAEELAFRGYVYRLLIPSRFENIDLKTFSTRALIISSVLFGLMHDRWLAAALAGALYALLMCRKGRLSDAVAAHMATNAVIFGWAIAAGQWSLL
jgi:exosortase E/protease (VPEID-CTERM system)